MRAGTTLVIGLLLLAIAIAPGSSFAAFVDRTEFRARQREESHRLNESFAHAAKLTALGTLVAGVGHEINNPLAGVLNYLRLMLRSFNKGPLSPDKHTQFNDKISCSLCFCVCHRGI